MIFVFTDNAEPAAEMLCWLLQDVVLVCWLDIPFLKYILWSL